MSRSKIHYVDRKLLEKDLDDIYNATRQCIGSEDFQHLKKLEHWGRLCSLAGYASSWIVPNPLSAFLISQGNFSRWTILTHPISHKGYDKITGIPDRYNSRYFARGWRRFIDWPDWITSAGWHQEHDVLHHYHLGEKQDPDCLHHNLSWLADFVKPLWLRYLLVALTAATWKLFYYVPKTHKELHLSLVRKQRKPVPDMPLKNTWSFFSPEGKALWFESVIPYTGFRFVLLPLLFFPLGQVAVFSVLLNSLMAEIMTNLHTFLMIMPNHTGDDLYVFDKKCTGGRGEFYLRQIIGSVNYRTGSDFNDFLHGWLNYQIEHHLWPDLPLLQYQRLQPHVKAVCEKHGLPYRQQSVFKRLLKAIDIMVGRTQMQTMDQQAYTSEPLVSVV
ncbi:MAG: fatty acid desaturase [Gammaproteobacteria bacterium]|nr:fatty acid desaturase [Gammaproteobacteria bacterium]